MTKVDDSQQAIELLVTITFKWLDNRINVTDLEEATEAEVSVQNRKLVNHINSKFFS